MAERGSSVILFGLGGIGGHVAAALRRMPNTFVLGVDGDTVSLSNLDRQLFTQDDLGKYKATVFRERGLIQAAHAGYLSPDRELYNRLLALFNRPPERLTLFGAVDNMPARRHILEFSHWLEDNGIEVTVILAGNEVNDAEAIAYNLKHSVHHPYVLVPEMRTSNEGHDPLRACTAGVSAPQTYLANLTAAVLGLQLMRFWASDLDADLRDLTPLERTSLLQTAPARLTCHGIRIRAYPERTPDVPATDYPG